MKQRFAIIIGAMKSGTTSLFHHLSSHPEVLPCRVKEPKFFSDEKKWAYGFDWYRSLWDLRDTDQRVALEATTDYAKHPAVPSPARRIAEAPGEFRLLYILRNPLDRIESHHTHAFERGWTEQPLEDGVVEHHINVSRYAMQLDRYLEHFEREAILLLDFEDLKRDPLALMQRVCGFLEIDPEHPFLELDRAHNTLREASAPRSRLARLAARLGLRRLRPPRFSAPPARRFQLSPEQREFALGELRDDLRRLRDEHGFDVSRWGLDV